MNLSAEYQAIGHLSPESLVARYSSLVRRVAYHLAGRLPDSVDVDDLIQAGMLGLIEAAGKYRGEQGASFETYASIRMRGAMLDELRRTDWVPRSVHRSVREMVEAVQRAEIRLGRHATDSEIAAELGVSLDRYHEIAREAVTCRMFSTEELAPARESALLSSSQSGPEERLERRKAQDALSGAITQLPEREALVMSLYYSDELNMREIGEVLGVSESRVCQLHGQALARLRARLVEWRQ
ncbi:MAG: RNA polymerase sigma factor FliA [Wenzhouxiangella sp.]|nr:RNA polymerase sigma factor FliA [Wenzhouxiangella sp.]